jgi:hypothetical protein
MGRKLVGEYYGKYTQTTVEGGVVQSTGGKATLKIAEVGEGAFLITVVDDGKTTFNDLSYLEGHILRGIAQSGEGVVSTYFEDDRLIHQLSNKSPTVWKVKNYRFKKCDC